MKLCTNSIGYNDLTKETYVNMENQVGITSKKILDTLCIDNHNKGNCDIYLCEKRKILFDLLGNNEKS